MNKTRTYSLSAVNFSSFELRFALCKLENFEVNSFFNKSKLYFTINNDDLQEPDRVASNKLLNTQCIST